jgi:hypothetical protein
MKLSDFPPEVRARLEKALADQPKVKSPTELARAQLAGAVGPARRNAAPAVAVVPLSRPVIEKTSGIRAPNKTEAEYNRLYLGGAGLYEAITLKLPGGSRYTPDWVTFDGDVVTLHEVKGSFRFGSHGRAVTAFRECAAAFPCFAFVWAARGKGTAGWTVTRHERVGRAS